MKDKTTYVHPDTGNEYVLANTPIYAGGYRIGDSAGAMNVMLPTKPKWLHRKFCELLLGWKWIDEKDFARL